MKITFLGAGSTIFAKNVLGDVMLTPSLQNSDIVLFDIDERRLFESKQMLDAINKNCNAGRARISVNTNRRNALEKADFVVNAVQIGGYDPCTIIDFEVPKKYGLRQTIGDTLGIGGIFRALRTIPVMHSFAQDMADVCPNAWLLNYTNPMSILTGYMQRFTSIKTIGLCHSVQVCADTLLKSVNMPMDHVAVKIAGINHMAWLLEIKRMGVDLYPEIKSRSKLLKPHDDMVRHEIMHRFGYYVTESSEHNAEYMPYFIKSTYPELIKRFNIPLDEYPRRCIKQIDDWAKQKQYLTSNSELAHERTYEYASYIMEAIVKDKPYTIGGNLLNGGCIENLPREACVEVPCLVNGTGIAPCTVGRLPEVLAALNRSNINVHLLTIEAAVTRKKEAIYHAAFLDPHTSAELTIDEIVSMCDEMITAHKAWLPEYR